MKSDKEIRLNRFLALCGVASRRKCDEMIAAGRVKVNGEVVTEMGIKINPNTDVVELDGKRVEFTEDFVYVLMNKPKRTVCTVKDEKHRKTVVDLLRTDLRVFPVGRLDFNTTGVLLITNDGDLAFYLTHPKFEVKKVYRVLLNKVIRPLDLHRFQTGVDLDGYITAPCKARELRIIDNKSYLEVELHEGKNRQIRRMFEKLGYNVEELQRIEFAGLRVNDLKPGEWRLLTPREIRNLKRLIEIQKDRILALSKDGETTHKNSD